MGYDDDAREQMEWEKEVEDFYDWQDREDLRRQMEEEDRIREENLKYMASAEYKLDPNRKIITPKMLWCFIGIKILKFFLCGGIIFTLLLVCIGYQGKMARQRSEEKHGSIESVNNNNDNKNIEDSVLRVVESDAANIRDGAGTEFNIITTVPKNTKLSPTGNINGNWIEIYLENGIGWISESTLYKK